MTLFELYLWIAGIGAGAAVLVLAISALVRAWIRRRLRRLERVLDLSPFIPAGALRQRPPAN